jgi:hypothetical protein
VSPRRRRLGGGARGVKTCLLPEPIDLLFVVKSVFGHLGGVVVAVVVVAS